jgi:hypothetical protein
MMTPEQIFKQPNPRRQTLPSMRDSVLLRMGLHCVVLRGVQHRRNDARPSGL